MKPIKVYWYNGEVNFGDMLTPIILNGLGIPFKQVKRGARSKLLAVGSIIYAARDNDVLWGTGTMRDKDFQATPGMKVLAVRGPKTREKIKGCFVPEIYGDPAILLPEIYTPKKLPRHEVGFIPHYVDKKHPDLLRNPDRFIIDVQQDPFKTIDEICSCDLIVSSSLHGIIVAEAYGIPAVWIKLSDKLIGGSFKFNDYFLGSGREERNPDQIGDWHVIPKPVYEKEKLKQALLFYYGKN
jgi:pyruvyltransferase